MKHFFYILVLVFVTSCSLLKQQAKYTYITDKDEQLSILYKHYPTLWYYYQEGVMELVWIKKYDNEQGESDYRENHYFKRNYITDYSDKMYLLKTNFPEIYNLFTIGKVTVDEMYKYVDDDGHVQIHISYRNL